jgi:subtilisin family serine protease
MKKSFFVFLVVAVMMAVLPAVSVAAPMERKIVVFEKNVLNEAAREALMEKFGVVKIKDLDLIGGKAVLLSPKAIKALAESKGVVRVEEDAMVYATGKAVSQPLQVIPWGIGRIGAPQVWNVTAGAGIKVAVIDTGIDFKHPDLAANIIGGYNAINPLKSAQDDNGHGTHVAGIIAAADNSIGVVGAGPQINLYAVKVLNRAGSGYISDIIEGLDWAMQKGAQVVNMSLGTSSDVQSMHDALIRLNQVGIVIVAAAGNNSGGAVDYPGAYPEVIAVSATDSGDKIASFSSIGQQVDLAAPGASIFSTYKGATYKALSGTSMASPHVAGAAALLLSQTEKCDVDLNGICSPVEVLQKLRATATDFGEPGVDNIYGAGLVNIAAALQ